MDYYRDDPTRIRAAERVALHLRRFSTAMYMLNQYAQMLDHTPKQSATGQCGETYKTINKTERLLTRVATEGRYAAANKQLLSEFAEVHKRIKASQERFTKSCICPTIGCRR
jgi:hypothetical protein